MTMIEEPQLRDLYKMESEDHLKHLDAGLLRLEVDAQDSATLELVFRAAHNLKGAAHMLGLKQVESIAHHFEDTLGAAKRGRLVLSSESIDRLYVGLDAISKLVNEAVTGEAANISVEAVLAQMNGAGPLVSSRSDAAKADVPVSDIAPGEPEEAASAAPIAAPIAATVAATSAPVMSEPLSASPPSPVDDALTAPLTAFKIETIRVEPEKMDGLMTLAAELTVTTTRMARGLSAYQEMMELREEWNKDVVANGAEQTDAGVDTETKNADFFEREQARIQLLGELLDRLKRTARDDVVRLNLAAKELEGSIRKIRLLPLSTVFELFPRMVRDLAREQGKEIHLTLEGDATTADKRILEELKDPLMHIIRNAIDHGIETPDERERNGKPRVASLRLRAYKTATSVVVEIVDDGRGLDEEAIKRVALKRGVAREDELAIMSHEQLAMLIFAPGFSTSAIVTDVSGRGVGLDVVRANVENLRGTVHVESAAHRGCTFRLQMPLTLATTRVLLVQVAGRPYGIPVESLQGSRTIDSATIFRIEGRDAIQLAGQPVSVAHLADLLDLSTDGSRYLTPLGAKPPTGKTLANGARVEKPWPCVIIALGQERLGCFVEALLDEQEVILQPLGALLKRVRNVAGSTILGTGEVCMILNPHDLMKTLRKRQGNTGAPEGTEPIRKKLILLAEDSITTRTQEKRILESAGYEVVIAVDGLDAFNKIGTRDFDAVVSDVEMPNMDGLTLAAKIRQDERYSEVPIVLVTSLASEDDRQRGVEVGANAYLTKGSFDQDVLIETLRRLI